MIIKSIPYVVNKGDYTGFVRVLNTRKRVKWLIQCNMCGNQFIRCPWEVKGKRKTHFCNMKCLNKANKSKSDIVCSSKGCNELVSMRSWTKKYCKKCPVRAAVMAKNYRRKHFDRMAKKYKDQREVNKKELHRLLGGKCKGCGENDPMYFQIDHVYNDGHIENPVIKSGGSLGSIELRHYLRDPDRKKRYQLLCANCNQAKKLNGGKLYKPKKKRKAA